ncbi:tRNA (adenosine(37)-N6)-threonylcarbamoyltransferase complex ATPase subunit type 1 TsaE [Niabella insulamsoli]|uniref:tRNA (adenosine(37)-N6)-threonylcarbamoyltransferase complex ATPase subunit type 1 TsaE n=1 Tax=Niabella insulamsoli TaxID=3144874 RepID=UPI0031FCB40C
MHAVKTYRLAEIKQAAAWLREQLKDRKVVALHGDMGAGKTTLVNAFCELMEVSDAVSSPTFSIINEYNFPEKGVDHSLYHIDLYRLQNEEEAKRAGVEDCLYSGDYCFVEWPERATTLFPPETVHVYIHLEDDTTRRLELGQK